MLYKRYLIRHHHLEQTLDEQLEQEEKHWFWRLWTFIDEKIITRDLILMGLVVILGFVLGQVLFKISDSMKMVAALFIGLSAPFFFAVLGELRRPLILAMVGSLGQLAAQNPWSQSIYYDYKPGFPISLPFLISIALCIWWFYRIYIRQDGIRFYGWVTLPFALLNIWALSTFIFARDIAFVIAAVPGVTAGFLLYFYGANLMRRNEDIEFLTYCIAVCVLAFGILGLGQFLKGDVFGLEFFGEPARLMEDNGMKRAAGTLGHPNAFGLYQAMFLPLILIRLLLEQDPKKLAFLTAAAGVGLSSMILCFSRGVWAGFGLAMIIVMMMFLIFPTVRQHFRGTGVRFGIFSGLGFLLMLPLLPKIIARLTGDDHGSAESRVPLAEMAKLMIRDYPITGVGLGNYKLVVLDYGPNSWYFDYNNRPYAVHNFYLYMMAELGLVAFSVFIFVSLGFLYAGLKGALSDDRIRNLSAISLLGGLGAIYFSTTSEDLAYGEHRFLFLCFVGGLVVGAGNPKEEHPPP